MLDLKGSGVQIVTSIIGSSVLLFAITTGYSEFNKPDVSARILPNINGTSIEVTNNGRAPATNFILTVESPANIADYEIFSTENRTILLEDDNHTLVAKFPRFVHGSGSLIKIEIFSAAQKQDSFNQNYDVYATYDQDSLRIASQMQQATTISIPYGTTIALTIVSLLIFAIPYFYTRAKRNRQRLHNKLVFEVAKGIFYIKQDCKRDLSYFESLEKKAQKEEEEFKTKVHGERSLASIIEKTFIEQGVHGIPFTIVRIAERLNDIKDIFKYEADFDVISKFYIESASRILEEKKWSEGLQKNRKEIAVIAEETLGKIRWEEYGFNLTNVNLGISDNDRDYIPDHLVDILTTFRRYNIAIAILRPTVAILIIPIVLSIGSVISGDPLEWIQRFETYHWLLFAGAVFLGVIIFLSRLLSDLVFKSMRVALYGSRRRYTKNYEEDIESEFERMNKG
jgi:hypothetical protein